MSLGEDYHRLTKHERGKRHNHFWDWKNPPSIYKKYDNPLKVVSLPEPELTGGKSLYQTINERRSRRDYSLEPMSLKEVSQLCWATQGISADIDGYHLRTAPSAGALYPVDTYLVVNNVKDLERGVYHYNVLEHSIEFIKKGDFRSDISKAALNQDFIGEAGVVFIWTAVVHRTKWKYGERGYRYIYKDSAHVCANLYLTATSLDLGCCAIGACYDDEVDKLLGIDGEDEITVYLASVGNLADKKEI